MAIVDDGQGTVECSASFVANGLKNHVPIAMRNWSLDASQPDTSQYATFTSSAPDGALLTEPVARPWVIPGDSRIVEWAWVPIFLMVLVGATYAVRQGRWGRALAVVESEQRGVRL
jgi:hypothetical protein